MTQSSPDSAPTIQRHHHVTLCTGGAQEDYDFHTKVLSLKSVKKTALYDGVAPIYHLYYGNDLGQESTLVTCFPMRQSGRKGRKGTGQVTILSLSVPVSSLGFWKKRLESHGRADARGRALRREDPAVSAPVRHRLRALRDQGRPAQAVLERRGARRARDPRHARHHRERARSRVVGGVHEPGLGRPAPGQRRQVRALRLRRGRPGQDRRLRARAEPGAGDLDVRRRDHSPLRVPGRRLRRAGRGQGAARGARVHRHLGAQGPRLLRLDVRAHAVGRDVRGDGLEAARLPGRRALRGAGHRASRSRRSSPAGRRRSWTTWSRSNTERAQPALRGAAVTSAPRWPRRAPW